MSIVFHHYKELMKRTDEVEEIMVMEGNVNDSIMEMEMQKFCHIRDEENCSYIISRMKIRKREKERGSVHSRLINQHII